MDSSIQRRVICRKLPPAVTSEIFLAVPIVQREVNEKNLILDFYQNDDIGETSAPNTSVAILTGMISNEFIYELSQIEFDLPFGGKAKPQVELAPIQLSIVKRNIPQKPLPSIDDEPEFVEFSKTYKDRTSIPSDAQIPVDELPVSPLADNSEVIRKFNIKMLGQEKAAKISKEKSRGGRGGR